MNRMSRMDQQDQQDQQEELDEQDELDEHDEEKEPKNEGVKTGTLPERDSLDIGMEQLVFDTNEVVHEGEKETRLAHTSVGAHTKDRDPQLSETEGSMVQNTASSFDEAMRNGVMDFRASFDLAKNAFSIDQATPPRKKKLKDSNQDFVVCSGHPGNEDEASREGRESELHSGVNSILPGEVEDNYKVKLYSAELIKYDLPRTLPTLKFFHDGGSLNSDLERVLCAYIVHAPQVGYVQGMSFVVAMLLLYLDDSEALLCFVNLLKRRGIGEFFHLRREALDAYVNCFDYFFEQSLPLLFHHMKREGLSSDMFLLDWHLTLFVKPLPLDCAARVWDVFLGADETYGLRIALGILRLFAPELSTMGLESLMSFLTRLPDNLNADMLLQSVEEIKVPFKKFEKVRERELAKVEGRVIEEKKEKEGCVLV